jgi:dimethylhistidine N-methyltransferase
VITSRLGYFKPNFTRQEESFAQEISHSLRQDSKFLNPKFFYNKTGSLLFDKICKLPEYYLTRTEINILKQLQKNFQEYLVKDYRLIELGSGSAIKTRLILDILDENQEQMEYVPIDVSEIIRDSSQSLLNDYPKLHITGIIDKYESGLEFIKKYDDHNYANLIIFLGSSLGNLEHVDVQSFLKKINHSMKESDLFLIGLDLVKEKHILEKAYNDSQGITAKFNLNILSRINEELGGNFVLDNFIHHSLFNEEKNRIETYLRSKIEHTVHIKRSNLVLQIKENELIHTEYSHKYTISSINEMMNEANFKIKQIWQDQNKHYCLVLAEKRTEL